MNTVSPSDLVALSQELREGTLTPGHCVERALERAEMLDGRLAALVPEDGRRGRLLDAVNRLSGRNGAERAGSSRGSYPAGPDRPPLYGVPVGVKDIFRVDGLPMRAGSKLPEHLFSGPEAESVARLKRAGGLVFAKTVTTEFAYFAPGPTANPWNTNHTPGGSSSGSAAAVAAGYVPLALGTQTIGSVIRPAAFCGIVGFKPGIGRIPTGGVFPFSGSVDHVGFFVATAASAQLAASVLCDDWDASVPAADGRKPVLGLLEDAYTAQADAPARAAMESAADRMSAAGYEVRRLEIFTDIEKINALHNDLIAHEFARVHGKWYEEYGSLYSPKSRELVEKGRAVTAARAATAREEIPSVRSRVERTMDRAGVSALLSPATVAEAPRGLEATGNPVMNLPWTFCGVPAITVPAGLGPSGLPLGVQITGRPGADESLLATAVRIERELDPMPRPESVD